MFNAMLATAFRRAGGCDYLSWRRMYPPLLYRGASFGDSERPPLLVENTPGLDWHKPWTWRVVGARAALTHPRALILPWLHPVSAPPYLGIMHQVRRLARVVICHNVALHEPMRFGDALTRSTLKRADLLVIHSREQVAELEDLGLGSIPRLEAFLPRLSASQLAPLPSDAAVEAEVARQGPGLRLLVFGAVRPYKGVDLLLEAVARRPDLDLSVVVAGRFWRGSDELAGRVRGLGIGDRVQLRDGYVSARETAVLMRAAHAVVLPYRSASQSGVVQLAFAYGRPVLATRVGGLPEAVRDGVDGLLCDPSPEGLAAGLERMVGEHQRLEAGVEVLPYRESAERYAHLIEGALEGIGR